MIVICDVAYPLTNESRNPSIVDASLNYASKLASILPHNPFAFTGCSEKKYNAQNRYSIQTKDDTGMKQRPIDR